MPKIAIVGGGPAGTSFVRYLLAAGVAADDLLLIDRATFPRPKLCGGALTFRGTEALSELLPKPSEGCDTRELEFRCLLGRFPVRERGGQWLYDRAYLDNELMKTVLEAGVEVRQGVSLKRAQSIGDRWELQLSDGKLEVDWLVGADGARSIVAREAKLRRGITGRLVEAVYEKTTSELDPGVLYFDFDPIADGIPGYGWLFPYPKPGTDGLWKLGIMDGRGVTKGDVLRKWTDDLAAWEGFRRVESKIAGWPEHYWTPRTQAHRPGLILTGEAWGIDALLGEGIAPSLEISKYAAGRLKEALDGNKSRIPGYERRFRRTAPGKNLYFQYHLARLIYGKQGARWLRVLFGHEYMHELATAGTEAYGQLQKHTFSLSKAYAWQVLRKGFPSNAPLRS